MRHLAGVTTLAAALVLPWPGTAASQGARLVTALRPVQDELTSQPPISDASPASVVGVQLERGDERLPTLELDLLHPGGGALPAQTCVTARSQDARFTFVGEHDAASQPSPAGPLRVKGPLKAQSAAYLAALPLRQLALLAQAGPCHAAAAGLPRFILADPRPTAGTASTARLRVLLNAPEGRIGLGLGSSEASAQAAPDQACVRSKARETGAFSVECLVNLPGTSPVYVEVRRHRFGNAPLTDRFMLLVGPR